MVKIWNTTPISLVLEETQGSMPIGPIVSSCMGNPSSLRWHSGKGNGEMKNILRQMTGNLEGMRQFIEYLNIQFEK